AREVRTTIAVGDHVGVREDGLAVVGVVDEAHVDLDVVKAKIRLHRSGAADDHGLVVQQFGLARQVLREGGHAALLVEGLRLGGLSPLVREDDLDAAREEGQLAQPAPHAAVVVALDFLEDCQVGVEGDLGAGALLGGLAEYREGLHHFAVLEGDAVVLAVAPHLGYELGGERVHYRAAHAVEPARHLVGAGVELTARVKFGEDDLDGGAAFALHGVYGDAAAVVGHASGAVLVEGHFDRIGEAGQAFVDGVVDDLGQ